MVGVAIALDLSFAFIAFGARTIVQYRRTGDLGWRLGRPRTVAEATARFLMLTTVALLVASVVAAPAPRNGAIGGSVSGGALLGFVGVAVVALAQWQMGASWRIGVDVSEHTELVTTGVYRFVRNPIYTGMVVFVAGHAVLLPGPWGVAAVIVLLVGVEVQVRAVEEPYLRNLHGAAFDRWAGRAGRFWPSRHRRF